MGCNQSSVIQHPNKRNQSLSLHHSQIFSSPQVFSSSKIESQSVKNSPIQSPDKQTAQKITKLKNKTNLISLLKSKQPCHTPSYNQISFKLQFQDSIIETEEPTRKRINLIELLKQKQKVKDLTKVSENSQEYHLDQQSPQYKSISTIKHLSQRESSFIVDSNELSKLSFDKYSIRLVEKPTVQAQIRSARQLPSIQQLEIRKSFAHKSTYLSPTDVRFNRQYSRTATIQQTFKIEKSVDEKGNKKINDYVVVSYLGQGNFGKVKKVYCQKRNQFFALKCCNKRKLKKKLLSRTKSAYTFLEQEIAILKKMEHPNIVRLIEVIDDPNHDKLYLLMDYIEFGSVNSKSYWKKMDGSKLDQLGELKGPTRIDSEIKLRRYFRQFLLGLDYIHNVANVVHRDIKPDNLLISQQDVLKIGDFGVSLILDQNEEVAQDVGTKAYLAPECFLMSRTVKWKLCDIWAAGVTFFQLITGYLPFKAVKFEELKYSILNIQPQFPNDISDDLKDLLEQCLMKDPSKRISLERLNFQQHSWVTNQNSEPLIEFDSSMYNEHLILCDNDIRSALSKLTMKARVKITAKLKQRLDESRQRLISNHTDKSTPKIH